MTISTDIKKDDLPEELGDGVQMGEFPPGWNANEVYDPAKDGEKPAEGGDPPPPAEGGGPPPPVTDDQVEWFNKLMGTDYKTAKELQGANLSERLKATPVDQEALTNYESLKKQNEYLKSKINPLSHFKDEKEYIRQQMLLKHPDLDPNVLTSIVQSDLDKMSPVDVLRMKMKIAYPELQAKDSQLNELIEEQYGISIDGFDPEDGSLPAIKIKMAVADAKKEFDGLQADISVPDMESIEKERTEKIDALSNEWKPFVSDLPAKLDKVAVMTKDKDGKEVPLLEYEIDDGFKESVRSKIESIVESQAERGVVFSQEQQDALVDGWKKYYLYANLPQIITNHVDGVVSEMNEEDFQNRHNPSQRPDVEKPEDGSEVDLSMQSIEADIMGKK